VELIQLVEQVPDHYLQDIDQTGTESTIQVDVSLTEGELSRPMASSSFGFVAIPPALEHLVGTLVPGTRVYRSEGDQTALRHWLDGLCHHIGPCLSPGGSALYIGVSRAAVHKRMNAGGLAAFCFYLIAEKKLKQLPMVYIPLAECKAWRAALGERFARLTKRR
jgi:hypothetical protein